MIDYSKALYRRNNAGQPCVWYGEPIHSTSNSFVEISYGILGKTITIERLITKRNPVAELQSKINNKRKTGYKLLEEISDSTQLPVEELYVIAFLNTYLPHDRTTADGTLLPMLAKLYDNKDDKLYRNGDKYIGQPKLNGLRCLLGASYNSGDMFKPVKLIFQSREGTIWNSLDNLEDYLLKTLDRELIGKMLDENWFLDGELYLDGYTVNQIDSFVKTPSNSENKSLQYWCYDIAISNMSQRLRLEVLDKYLSDYIVSTHDIKHHGDITNRLVRVPDYDCFSHDQSLEVRNLFIKWGFEGLIIRDPEAEYQFGKRNSAMWKYKAVTDGIFNIKDIIPEGDKRSDIPLLVLINDINDSTFNVHITGSHEYQRYILRLKENYIHYKVFVEYGERSGVNQVPFHVKSATFVYDDVQRG